MRPSLVLVGFVIIALGSGVNAGQGHEHQHQGYFQYANVPAKGQYEFGYNRGNPYHYTSRYEQGNNWRFRTKVRWGDKSSGYGEHYWDYNHVDKGGKGQEGQTYAPQQGWQPQGGGQHGSYSEISPAVAQPHGLKDSNNLM